MKDFLKEWKMATTERKGIVHPYIPNSVPEIKAEMMREIGMT